MTPTLPEGFTLPPGYSLHPPPEVAEVQGVTVDGEKLYGGADISDHYDAEHSHWVFCDANKEGDTPPFKFRAFWRPADGTAYTERPLPNVTTGRGNADIQWIDGCAHYSAWEGNAFFPAPVPGFAPFPSIPALDARLTVVEQAAIGADPRVTELLLRIKVLEERAAGGFALAPSPVTAAAWEGRLLSGGVLVDVPAVFGVPIASAYLIRFVAQAPAANVRVRAGSEAAPFFVTVNTQVPNLQVHTQGWAPATNGSLYISTVNGQALVWLQIIGY